MNQTPFSNEEFDFLEEEYPDRMPKSDVLLPPPPPTPHEEASSLHENTLAIPIAEPASLAIAVPEPVLVEPIVSKVTPLARQNLFAASAQSQLNKSERRKQWEQYNPKIKARLYHPDGYMCEIRCVNKKKQFAYWDETSSKPIQVYKKHDQFQTPDGKIVFSQEAPSSILAPR